MSQITTWTMVLVYDELALPGGRWWARLETDGSDGEPWVVTTTLHAGPQGAWNEAAVLLMPMLTTAERQP